MNWISFAWPMATGAFLTMALVHLWTGLRKAAEGRVNLLFATSAIFAATYSWFELWLTQAGSPAEFLARLRFLDLAAGGVAVSLVIFVWDYFGTGRKWLGLVGIGVMLGSLIPDLLPVPKLVFLEITIIRKVSTFGGATYTLAEGLKSPWNVVFYLGVLLLLAFVADASLTLWRRGERRKALVVGGTVIFFYLFGGLQTCLTDLGVLKTPYLVAFCWMAILVVMAWELSNDQLRAEQLAHALRENQERMRLATKAADLGIWEWDITGDEIWTTEAGRARVGVGDHEKITPDRVLQVVHPDDREAVRTSVRRAVESAGELDIEFRIVAPGGELRWVTSRGQVERSADGTVLRMRGVTADITERKAAEAEAQRQRSELARVQRVSTMGQLASTLAHELNQPLGAILRNAEAGELFLHQDPPDVEEVRAILADIKRDNQRAGAVIDRMRLLLKRREPQQGRICLKEVLEQVALLVRGESQTRHVALHVELADDLPLVQGDSVQVQQVLLNLVMNAMEAMDGTPAEHRQVIITARRADARFLEVTVIDKGHGISGDQLPRLFEPFFTTKAKGLGVGLPISQTIIQSHGGRVWAENNPEGGTTFRFTLRVARDEGRGAGGEGRGSRVGERKEA